MSATIAHVLFRHAAEDDRFLNEGPRCVTVDGREALAWVNIQTAVDATAGAVHLRFWDTEEHRVLPQPQRPGFLLPTDRGGLVFVGREKGVGLLDLATNAWTPLATIPDDSPRTIVNDGEVVPGGRAVVFGTKDLRFEEPIAHVYLYTLDDGRLTTLDSGHVCSNGKVFARDAGGIVLFDIDTPRRNVTRYRLDLDTRTMRPEGVALDLSAQPGFPDGMVEAGDGTVIVAFYNPEPAAAGRAVRFRLETGEVLETWAVPGSPRVTCPLLIRNDGAVRLVLTTATESMPVEQRRACPEAGNLFVAETALPAVPPPACVRLDAARP
jgi:sugar lactone lactonase YvrE